MPPVVHVAGTNGKGSVVAFLRAALEADGRRVHCYTSPHLVRFHERVRLAAGPGRSALIAEDALVDVLEECAAACTGASATFFEITTAAAFLAFSRVPADVLLLETGLGGRLDATNVVARPALTAITPVSIDHTGFLGANLAGIAAEKAGILKPGVPAVVARQPPAALAAIAAVAAERGAPLRRWGRDWSAGARADGTLWVQAGGRERGFPAPALAGPHQIENAGQAVACLAELPRPPSGDAVAAGLRAAAWPGRLQRLDGGPLAARLPPGSELWVDGGHNAAAAAALARAMRAIAADVDAPLHLVAGLLTTKDPEPFVGAFRGMAAGLVSLPVPGGHASHSADAMAVAAGAAGIPATDTPDIRAALDAAAARAAGGSPPRVLICGSLYLAGAALAADGRRVV